jgi:hypothetical protein
VIQLSTGQRITKVAYLECDQFLGWYKGTQIAIFYEDDEDQPCWYISVENNNGHLYHGYWGHGDEKIKEVIEEAMSGSGLLSDNN